MNYSEFGITPSDIQHYLIRLYARLIVQPLLIVDTGIYLRHHQRFRFHKVPKALPCIAFALAPAV